MKYTIKARKWGKRQISFACPSCSSELLSPVEEAGKRFPCPQCGHAFVTPGTEQLERETQTAREAQEVEQAKRDSQAKIEASERRQATELEVSRRQRQTLTPISRNRVEEIIVFGVVLGILPVAAGGVIIYYCAQIPCVGILGVIIGFGLIVFGLMSAGAVTGVIKLQGPQSNPAMVCPHCQARGMVKTERVKLKKGVSGAKATAAILTGGASILATGLSQKEAATRAHCTNCGNTWSF